MLQISDRNKRHASHLYRPCMQLLLIPRRRLSPLFVVLSVSKMLKGYARNVTKFVKVEAMQSGHETRHIQLDVMYDLDSHSGARKL